MSSNASYESQRLKIVIQLQDIEFKLLLAIICCAVQCNLLLIILADISTYLQNYNYDI